jgi:CRISPR-associated protein Csd1
LSWMQHLYETYENCEDIVGVTTAENKGVLLPVAHTLIKAHITAIVDEHGALLDAFVREDIQGTVAPCTEDSESRSGTRPVPHPLFDKLMYLAGDYEQFSGISAAWAHEAYIRQLAAWCDSPYGHPKVKAILAYLQRGSLIADLIEKQVLATDTSGKLLDKWTGQKEDAPDIFRIRNVTPSQVFVRFLVQDLDAEDRVWMDPSVRESFIAYTLSRQEETRLCYVTGEKVPYIEKHPKKIVNTLANAKLISGNDSHGFTFRGRFDKASEAVSIGYLASLKAHNALRYLVETRGFPCDTQTIVAWGTRNEPVPPPILDTDELMFYQQEPPTAADRLIEAGERTQAGYARRLNAALLGRKYQLDEHSGVVVMALDCATTGRLSITFYRELNGKEYLERVKAWHESCAWLHSYKTDRNKQRYTFIGAPSSMDIALAAYGRNANKSAQRRTIERLLPCIFDAATIPSDLVRLAVSRASQPMAMEPWEWSKTLSVACALYRKQHEREGYDLALDENRKDRSYLFGRLLAVADQLERRALLAAGEKRETNAMRLMNAFSQRPVKTWLTLSKSLRPYQARLRGVSHYYDDLITQITDSFAPEDFNSQNDKPLDGLYLLGYHSQRQVFLDAIKAAKEKKDMEKMKVLGQDTEETEN